MKWQKNAECVDHDPELFFPGGGTDTNSNETRMALRVCSSCVVSTDCLKYALTTYQESGIWGGKTERTRRELLRVWQKKTGQTRQNGIVFTEEFFAEASQPEQFEEI